MIWPLHRFHTHGLFRVQGSRDGFLFFGSRRIGGFLFVLLLVFSYIFAKLAHRFQHVSLDLKCQFVCMYDCGSQTRIFCLSNRVSGLGEIIDLISKPLVS